MLFSIFRFDSFFLRFRCVLNVTRFGIMSRKSPKVELRYGPRKSE